MVAVVTAANFVSSMRQTIAGSGLMLQQSTGHFATLDCRQHQHGREGYMRVRSAVDRLHSSTGHRPNACQSVDQNVSYGTVLCEV